MEENELIKKKPVMLDFIAHAFDVYNNRQLAEYGVTHSQAKILVRLSHAPGNRLPQSEFKSIGRRGSTITSLLSNLEKGGYIRREPSETDARAKDVEITATGAFIAMLAFDNIEILDEAIDDALTKKEAKEFQRLLEKVTEAIHNDLLNDDDDDEEGTDDI